MRPVHHLAPVLPSLCLLLLASAAGAVRAGDWSWQARFTEASSPELKDLHSAIHDTDLGASHMGVPVSDAHFTVGPFDLHLKSGTIWHEPVVGDVPAGAFFEGEGTVSFTPDTASGRSTLQALMGNEALAAVPVDSAWLFTLRGRPLASQLGLDEPGSVPFQGSEAYGKAKLAARQLGMELLAAFLDRDGRSQDAAFVLFSPEMIRTGDGADAHLLYAYEPAARAPVRLDAFGHSRAIRDPRGQRFLERYPNFKYQFFSLVWQRPAEDARYVPAADVETVEAHIDVGKGTRVETRYTIDLVPAEGADALAFDLTSRLEVVSVTGHDGQALPFAQWSFLSAQPNFDERLVVHTAGRLPPGQPAVLEIVAAGPLFDPGYALNRVGDEDYWYPRLQDDDGAHFRLTAAVPKNMRVVASGRLVSEEVVGGQRTYRFETARPSKNSSFSAGLYDVKTAEADDTTVELFYIPDATALENPKYAVEEVANAAKVFGRILDHPLDMEHLRVATTPTGHGRGFEGLLLLSQYAATRGDLSVADLFRAHEVAHQWWGHVVRPRHWPEDRWLSEAFAEYCAMEYYQIRFGKEDRTRARMQEHWIKPLFDRAPQATLDLTGAKSSVPPAELAPLIEGTGNVYTKGPLVLHMLRYLFQVQQQSDEGFWLLLQNLLDEYEYQDVTTKEFMQLTERAFQGRLDWFWDQWIYGTKIPVVEWSHEVSKDKEGWVLTVQATQRDTEYVIPIPVYVQMPDGRTLSTPLVMRGKTGEARVVMPQKPKKVSLNDNYEALIELVN